MLAAERSSPARRCSWSSSGSSRWRRSRSGGLLGTAARVKADRDMAARMAAIGRPVPQTTASAADKPGTGWIPESVSSFGERFAQSRGFGEKLDGSSRPPASARAGEFVVATVGAGLLGAVLGAAILQKPLLAGVIGLGAALVPTVLLRSKLSSRADKMREQLPDVRRSWRRRCGPGTRSSRRSTRSPGRSRRRPTWSSSGSSRRSAWAVEDALEALADRVGSADFRWAVLAVNIQREVGGNLAEILDNVSDTLRERATMRRQIRCSPPRAGSRGSSRSCRSRSRCTCSR